jgi:hypothetical protein
MFSGPNQPLSYGTSADDELVTSAPSPAGTLLRILAYAKITSRVPSKRCHPVATAVGANNGGILTTEDGDGALGRLVAHLGITLGSDASVVQKATCPMEIEKILLEEAQYAVSHLKNRARALEPQLQEIEKLKLEIEAECQTARFAPKRLLEYRLKIDTEYQCPHCWINYERRSALRPANSTSDDRDLMRCQTCAAEFVIATR